MARKYALEIAAHYSQAFIRFMAAVLGWLWNRVFDGVELGHVEQLSEFGDGAEIIYVPCHRSHMDYLLLSYVIYRKGFAVPHVAAGINLNLPVIGRYLRKGGAFFLRRSFKGDALYAVVFAKYLGVMMARGHSLEYFIEGGRSRTGRLLPPRTGMLSMTVRAYLRDPTRRVIFMPVYFGYERIVEGRTYIGELSGLPKQKESVLGLIRSTISVLRSKLGKVHVNLGKPIALDELLSRHNVEWRSAATADLNSRAGWIGEAVDDLAARINTEINAAAAVTPINLVAMAVLATPRQALAESDLTRQLELYQRLLRDAPYSPLVTVTTDSGAGMIRYAEAMGMLERQKHPLGDIMRMNAESAVLATYYRNNILHLFAMPSLLACCFVSNESMSTADIHRLVRRIYPYISSELYLRWDESEVGVARRLAARELRPPESVAGPPRPNRVAAPGLDLARGNPPVGSCASHHSNRREVLPRDSVAVAIGQWRDRPRGIGGALPLDGPTHVGAVWLEFAGVLRQDAVPQFHRFIAAPKRDPGIARQQVVVRRASARGRRGRSMGALGADPAQHSAGHAGSIILHSALLLGGAAAFLRFDTPLHGTLGGPRLFADLRLHHRRTNQGFQAFLRRAAILFLAAFAHRLEEDAAVVDEFLAGEPAQAISHRGRQTGILRAARSAVARRSTPC